MNQHCHFCGGEIDITYGGYGISEGNYYCWTLSGGRDNCFEREIEQELRKEQETNTEQETAIEQETCTEQGHGGGDVCERCGQKNTWNPEKGI